MITWTELFKCMPVGSKIRREFKKIFGSFDVPFCVTNIAVLLTKGNVTVGEFHETAENYLRYKYPNYDWLPVRFKYECTQDYLDNGIEEIPFYKLEIERAKYRKAISEFAKFTYKELTR